MARKNKLKLIIFILIMGGALSYGELKYKIFSGFFKTAEKKDDKAESDKTQKEGEEKPKDQEQKPEDKKTEEKTPKEGEKPGEEAKEEAKEEEAVVVKAIKVKKGEFKDVLPILGTVEGSSEVDLKFEVNGIIDFFNFKEGDFVRKGDVVSRLNNSDAMLKVKYRQAKLEVAQTAIKGAQKKVDIYQNLYKIGAVIKEKLDETEIDLENKQKEYEAAKIEVESAKAELDKTYLKSPIDGVLGQRDADPGEFATSNTDVISVYDTKEVFVKIGVVEKDINKVTANLPVSIAVGTYPDKEFQGTVVNTMPRIQGKSRTLTVKAKISNEDNLLVPGMFAKGTITVYTKKDTISVPIDAVQGKEGESHVFIVDENSKTVKKDIKVGYIASEEIQIDEGLAEGDQVVTDSPVKLKEGIKVKVAEEKEEDSKEAPKGVGAEIGE